MTADGYDTTTGTERNGTAAGTAKQGVRPPAPRGRLPLLLSCTLLIASSAAYTALHLLTSNEMADMLVYRAEGMAVLHGEDLYGLRVTEWDLPATYPPFAAILFVPTTLVGIPALKILITGGNIALLALLVHLSFRFAGWPRRDRRPVALLLATALGIWLEPVFQTLHFGQVNLLITVLVLWDLSRPDGARTKGVALGVAAGIKLTPGIFAVYLLLTGRIRAGLAAAVAFAGTVAVGWGVLPGPSYEFWTRRLFETGRVGAAWIVDNQSLQGMVARVLHTEHPGAAWVAVAGITAVAGLAVSARAAGSGAEAWGVMCCAATALLISPISWSHHWVWCVPALALLAADATGPEAGSTRAGAGAGAEGWRRWTGGLGLVTTAALVAFLARSMWIIPKHGDLDLHLPWWQQPPASPYPLLALAFLAYAALRRSEEYEDPGSHDNQDTRSDHEGQGGRDAYGCTSSSPASSSSASTIR